MTYAHWLALLSAAFVALERVFPRYPDQRLLRPGIVTDLFYAVFNGHYLGVLIALASTPLLAHFDAALTAHGWDDDFHRAVLAPLPPWAQFVGVLFAVDLLHYGIHNLLHRVPFLWTLHKVHHSIEDMDFWGSLRFHWAETLVYKGLTYPLLAFFGARGDVLLALAVFNTAVGHWNHGNLRLRIGKLGRLLNHPEMHIWHHVHDEAGPPLRNFGITLSVWDYLFGTAHVPDHPPARLGFEGIETFPKTAPGQLVHPLPIERWVRARRSR